MDSSVLTIDIDEDSGRITRAKNVDYSVRSIDKLLSTPANAAVTKACLDLDKMRDDLDASFILRADESPKNILESLAARIFKIHTRGASNFERSKSGCEWWVQVRALTSDDVEESKPGGGEDECEEELKGESIQFHWDKDEVMGAIHGVYLFPALSTVTYLTDAGAPTVVVPKRMSPDGQLEVASSSGDVFLSYPSKGKHTVFDGRFLHAVPAELRHSTSSEERSRVTFLVNVWLDHLPVGLERFPSGILPLMEPSAASNTNASGELRAPVTLSYSNGSSLKATAFSFPLRISSDVSIELFLPNEVLEASKANQPFSCHLQLPEQKAPRISAADYGQSESEGSAPPSKRPRKE